MVSAVLKEKENYIGNLENEITEMRKEIEIQREQLVQAEETHQAQGVAQRSPLSSNPYMSLGGGPSVHNGSFSH